MKKNNSTRFIRFATIISSLSLASIASAAEMIFSNSYYYTSGVVITHTVGAATSQIQSDPASYASYASYRADSDYLYLETSSSVDASGIGEYGYDYVVAEAVASYSTDLQITGGVGQTSLSIQTFYDELLINPAGTTVYGEQSIRIIDNSSNTNELVFAYLQGVSDPNDLLNIALNFDTTFRLEMWSTAYSLAHASTSARNQREFSIALSVAEVPLPSTALLLGSGLIGLVGAGRKRKSI